MIDRLQGFFGFTRTPFGRELAPGMLHRHAAHGEAVARIGWCVAEHRIGVITGEVGAGKTVAVRAAVATMRQNASVGPGSSAFLTMLDATLKHRTATHIAISPNDRPRDAAACSLACSPARSRSR